nr:GNAT family N-acetyltransferase [Marinicella sp. W31]MDC2876440.1 GNAT family N-acetyltransferase [Marinicella sp. W31]
MSDEHLGLAADIHRKRFSPAWSAGELRKLLGQKPVFGHIARHMNRVVSPPASGFVLARSVGEESEILTICVDRNYIHNGVGWRLMVAAMQEARARGAGYMLLEVDANNGVALGLYRKLGFFEVGRRNAYYAHDDGTRSTALVLRRDLG